MTHRKQTLKRAGQKRVQIGSVYHWRPLARNIVLDEKSADTTKRHMDVQLKRCAARMSDDVA